MAASPEIQRCGSCNGSLAGQGFFTAECSHSFHLPCIKSHQNRPCPTCNAFLNNPFNNPPSLFNTHSNLFNGPPNPSNNPQPSPFNTHSNLLNGPSNPFNNPQPSLFNTHSNLFNGPPNPSNNPQPSPFETHSNLFNGPPNPFSNPQPSLFNTSSNLFNGPPNPSNNPQPSPFSNPFNNPQPSLFNTPSDLFNGPPNPFNNPQPSPFSQPPQINHVNTTGPELGFKFPTSSQNPSGPMFGFTFHKPYQNPSCPLFHDDPPRFSDDDPLRFSDDEPLAVVDTTSRGNLTKVAIKAVPERPAVAASESVSLFTLLVGLKAPPLSEDAQRAPIDIVTVLDVSGSMEGQKLDLVKRAVHFVIDNLGVSDRLSVVAFSKEAKRFLPLRRMTENGREDAHKAVDKLAIVGATNIVGGLAKGVKVLEERRERNPVSSIIFLSDGIDSYYANRPSAIVSQLPALINPVDRGELNTVPVHSFGFGSDHDPVTMHGISDASGGTFSFIGSIEMVQDAFAGCIGGLLSVVSQEVRLNLRSASHGVEIKSIPSGRYSAEILNQEAIVKIGDLYADEGKEFLISLSVPKKEGKGNTTLLDIVCSYKDTASKGLVQVEGDLVEIRRPEMVAPEDMVINIEVDRQRMRVYAAESIKEAQHMAETGDLEGATKLLAKKREEILGSASAKAGDSMCSRLAAEMKETETLMSSSRVYQESGRAFALAGMSSHAAQRATTSVVSGFGSVMDSSAVFGGYATPNMASMVNKSQQLNKKD